MFRGSGKWNTDAREEVERGEGVDRMLKGCISQFPVPIQRIVRKF